MCALHKPSQSTTVNHRMDWFESQQFSITPHLKNQKPFNAMSCTHTHSADHNHFSSNQLYPTFLFPTQILFEIKTAVNTTACLDNLYSDSKSNGACSCTPVVTAEDNGLSARWTDGIGELTFIFTAVVKLLLNTTIAAICKHFLVTSCCHERVCRPCQCIWWTYVLANFPLK